MTLIPRKKSFVGFSQLYRKLMMKPPDIDDTEQETLNH